MLSNQGVGERHPKGMGQCMKTIIGDPNFKTNLITLKVDGEREMVWGEKSVAATLPRPSPLVLPPYTGLWWFLDLCPIIKLNLIMY